MPDNILQDTLTGGSGLKDVERDISTLQSQYNPADIAGFNEVMQSVSQLAYQTRQTAEQSQLAKEFDPTQVSGGTFSDIMSWTEKHRGADVSKIAQSTMKGFQQQQRQVGTMLESLKQDRNRLQSEAKQFKFEMAAKYPGLYNLLSDDEKASIDNGEPVEGVFAKFDAYTTEQKRREDAWEAEKRNMQRASYQKTAVGNEKKAIMDQYMMKTMGGLRYDNTAANRGYSPAEEVAKVINTGLQEYGPDFEPYVAMYESIVEPTKTPAEVKAEQEAKMRLNQIGPTVEAAKGYTRGAFGSPDIEWSSFIQDKPKLQKDEILQTQVQKILARSGYKLK